MEMEKQASGTSVAELSIRAVILGLVLSVVMGMANVYLGLKVGMTVSASIPAAVVAMIILRGIFRNGTILEANQVQTSASAGESLAAGIIFTMPALILIGVWTEFDWLLTTLIAFTGGLLGILFMIPMRRVFVVSERKELKFPEGLACAAVLKAGDQTDDPSQAMAVVKGAAIGGAFKFLASFFHIIKHTLETAFGAGGRVFYIGGDISPALVAVGLIVRLNVSLLIFIGGGIAWLIGIPMLGGFEDGGDALDTAWTLWSTKIRYVGVGAMVVGGILSIFKAGSGIVEAVKIIGGGGAKAGQDRNAPDTERDIPSSAIMGLSALAVALVGIVYYMLTQSIVITAVTTIIMVVMSFFFTAVASYIVGLVGNSNSPVSGMTITAVLFTGGMLLLFGFTGTEGMVATLGVAAIVCCAACTSGDVCNDLKTGQLVGAAPFRQQMMQVMGVGAASLIMAFTLQLLHSNTEGGIGGRLLAAPQASLFASLAKGFFGEGKLPWDMVGWGVGVGILLVIGDYILEKKDSEFRLHVMPVAVGMYLPFGLAIPILIGGLLAHFIGGKGDEDTTERKLRKGVLFSSGIIAGESLTGVLLALLASMGLASAGLDLPGSVTVAVTILASIAAVFAFHYFSRPSENSES